MKLLMILTRYLKTIEGREIKFYISKKKHASGVWNF